MANDSPEGLETTTTTEFFFLFAGGREGWMQACMYVDRLLVWIKRPLAGVSLAAKPQRTLNAYKKKWMMIQNKLFTRDISECAMDTTFALNQYVSRYISWLYAVGVLIISLMCAGSALSSVSF